MSDLDTLCGLYRDHVIKIFMILGFIFLLMFLVNYFNIFIRKKDIYERIQDALDFKGFPVSLEPLEPTEVPLEVVDRSQNTHILIFGATGTGKTYFVKEYLKRNQILDYVVFPLDLNEWPMEKVCLDLTRLKDFESLKNKTVILDDQGGKKYHEEVSNLISKGRHHRIQVIFLAHDATDLNPKSRKNSKEIFVTTGNNEKFMKDLCQKLEIKIGSFGHLPFGMIRYNLKEQEYKVYDQYHREVFDSKTNQVKARSDFNPKKYVNVKHFSLLEKSELVDFLEKKGNIDIIDPLLQFYLNYYLIQNHEPVNMSKLKRILGDYYEEHKTFRSEKIIPLLNLLKDHYLEIVKARTGS